MIDKDWGKFLMKKSRVTVLFLFVLICCFLSGCADLLRNEEMDKELELLIEALNEDDADRIFQFMYPDVSTREEFDASYETIRRIWEQSDSYTTKLISINTNKTFGNSGASLTCRAKYYIYTEDKDYTVSLTYLSDDKGDGLYQFDLAAGAEPVLMSGGFTTAKENTAFQWVMLVFCVLTYLFMIVTVVDILRKRPRLFGVWLVAALTFFSLQMRRTPTDFHIGGIVTWFAMSAFKIYSNGIRSFVFALPAGAVVYWFLRKKLLSQKGC